MKYTRESILQDSEVAVLEVYAGDLPPQFVKHYYSVEIPEDIAVDSRFCEAHLIFTWNFYLFVDDKFVTSREF